MAPGRGWGRARRGPPRGVGGLGLGAERCSCCLLAADGREDARGLGRRGLLLVPRPRQEGYLEGGARPTRGGGVGWGWLSAALEDISIDTSDLSE